MDGTKKTQRKTVKELWEKAETVANIRQKRGNAKQKQREALLRKERERYLKFISSNLSLHWEKAKELIKKGNGPAYDNAFRLLVDLSDAYSEFDTTRNFQQKLSDFMANHMRRKPLIQRLIKAGIMAKP